MENILIKIKEIQSLWLVFTKTAINPFHKSKYLPLEKLWEWLYETLEEKNLLCYHNVNWDSLVTTIYDMDSKESISSSLKIEQPDPQKTWSSITYFKRYNLWCIFNIITDEDKDWNINKPKTWDTLKKIKEILKQNWITKTPEAEARLSKKLWKSVSLKDYTEEQAQKDFILLKQNG